MRHMQRTYLGVEVIFLHNWSYEYACVMQSVRPPLVNSERSDTQQGNVGLHGQVDELPIHTPHGPQSQRNTRSARDAEGHTAEILPHVPPYHRIPSSYVFPKPSTAPSMAAAPFDAVGRPPPWCSGERTPRKTRCARLETSSPHDRTTRGPTRESARQTHPSSEERERIDSLGPWRQLR